MINKPAYPYTFPDGSFNEGFTKLELASLMMAQALISCNPDHVTDGYEEKIVAESAMKLANAVLVECQQ